MSGLLMQFIRTRLDLDPNIFAKVFWGVQRFFFVFVKPKGLEMSLMVKTLSEKLTYRYR
jgi:hypothetical protein